MGQKGTKKNGAESVREAPALSAAALARRDRLVMEHLPLVKAIAVRMHENLPVHVDLDDLVHAGVMGLFQAANRFNPEKQVVFSSYAKHRIKGAILDSLRQLDWASRDMRRRHKKVEAVTRDLTAELQHKPTEAEVAQRLGKDLEKFREMMLDLRNVGLVSASTRSGSADEDLPAPEFPTDPENSPEAIVTRKQLSEVLGEALRTLPERYQKVVALYYVHEMTMKEIGGILGINESRVSQIHKIVLEKMEIALRAQGITHSSGSAQLIRDRSNPFPPAETHTDIVLVDNVPEKHRPDPTLPELLAQLPPPCRVIMMLHHVDGLAIREAGAKLGADESQALQIYAKAIELLTTAADADPGMKKILHALLQGEYSKTKQNKPAVPAVWEHTPIINAQKPETPQAPPEEIPSHLPWVLAPTKPRIIREARNLHTLLSPETTQNWVARAKQGKMGTVDSDDFPGLSAGL